MAITKKEMEDRVKNPTIIERQKKPLDFERIFEQDGVVNSTKDAEISPALKRARDKARFKL